MRTHWWYTYTGNVQSTHNVITGKKYICIMCSTKPWQIAAQKHCGRLATLHSKSARIKDTDRYNDKTLVVDWL